MQSGQGYDGCILRFNSGGFGHLCFGDRRPLACKELLRYSVWQTHDGEYIARLSTDDDDVSWLRPRLEAPVYAKWQSAKAQSLEVKIWPLAWMVRGCQLWVELLPMLVSVWHAGKVEDLVRPLLNSWPKLEKWVSFVVPKSLGLHRCIDRRKKYRSWFRFLPEHCVSIAGCLAILGMRETRCSETGGFSSDSIHQLLTTILNLCFSCQAILVPLVLDQAMSVAYTHPGIAPPPDISKHLLVT